MPQRRKPASLENLTRRWLRAWERCWGTPGLTSAIQVEESPRLRSTIARAAPAKATIRLSPELRGASPSLLREVLCHEAAHIAAYRLHGPGIRQHGPEWAELMARAGFAPRRRLPTLPPSPRKGPPALFEHRCPVCQARRLARRAMSAWRCASCVQLGLPGALTITRLAPRAARAP
ncbi:hypothetical protein FGE12_19080 [Aggregicoccus sp. 17bor-14]|uniref:SprT-like domain-containing protein n=1 Tax=Myxococcaceae TaxID=31 RepID=UPI00129CCFF7|nr:SprT-like domain-containing protein [Simulacricoccus sp. 17bor-14]MRI90255.1 hypothetical protein [Aggregicoccus sp. 17bor-14]